jgi:hypothetical protein
MAKKQKKKKNTPQGPIKIATKGQQAGEGIPKRTKRGKQ